MEKGKSKSIILLLLIAVMLVALSFGLAVFGFKPVSASAMEMADNYEGAYRNRLAFSAKRGWNNDPNGLLYVDGTWHMYYQYNYNSADNSTDTGWGNMSWGHATSTDLVHWTEQPVAIPAHMQAPEGVTFDMAFSGSAVYDEKNTSGLFDVDPETGKVVANQGIVAIFTEPTGGQQQMLAYSKDGGNNFEIKGEIISKDDESIVNDRTKGEFRDPKVFWNDKLGEWLMVVGGGSIRMYSSKNLLKWEYLGETGYWGECPDLSRYTVGGEEKYVLMMSPEDKVNSHKYNGTDRTETYYPAEYYVVGSLNEKGLFVGESEVTRLNEGIDCYAVQTWNNAPEGKVYGISWSASWKTCDDYRNIRKTYNGGMTVVTEFALQKEGESYVLTRNPVEKYKDLRAEDKLATYSGKLAANEEKLTDVNADVADIEMELDFTGSKATCAELWLRASAAERIKIVYNTASQTLTLDRSQSSLLAQNTRIFNVPYSKHVDLKDGKLTLRILLDRAFISVFAEGGRDNFFSAVFPSPASNGMKLTADGDINVKYDIYKLNDIFGGLTDADEMILTTNKIDGVVGKTYPVMAGSFAVDFDAQNVEFEAIDGADNIKITQSGATAYITLLNKGFAKVQARYNGQSQDIEIYIYENGFVSDVEYKYNNGGFSFYNENGMHLDNPDGDGFRFSDEGGKNYIYSAEFAPTEAGSQAAALIFNVSDNLTSYYVATADIFGGSVKLWRAPGEVLKESAYPFEANQPVKITVVVNEGTARMFVNDDKVAALTYTIENYTGGKLGLNVFKGWFNVNNVKFMPTDQSAGDIYVGGYTVEKVINLTDGNSKLAADEYTVEGGVITVKESYLKTLEAGKEYRFRAVTSFTDFDFTVNTGFFADVTVTPAVDKYYKDGDITLELGGNVTVERLFIDGNELAPADYKQENGKIIISAATAGTLTTGKHTVKLYTDKGRPEVSINVSEKVETIAEPAEQATHVFLWIDLAIFGAAILGYAAYSVIKRIKKK